MKHVRLDTGVGPDPYGRYLTDGGLMSLNLQEFRNMRMYIYNAAVTPRLGKIMGLLMAALLATSCAPQPIGPTVSSPNSVLIEMSQAGDIIKVTKANGAVIPRQDAIPKLNLYDAGAKHYAVLGCWICFLGDGCWPMC
jgi:hypothetical protein